MNFEWLSRITGYGRELRDENTRLLDEVQSLSGQVLVLQDRLDAALEDRSKMWTLMERSIDEMKIAYQAHINVAWQKQGHGVPYPDAPQIPHSAVVPINQEPIRRRELPSEAVAKATNQFFRTFAETLNT